MPQHIDEPDESARRLASTLRDGDARLVTLLGPGGIGKSRLADDIVLLIEDEDSVVAQVELQVSDAPLLARDDVASALSSVDAGEPGTRILVLHNVERLGARAREVAELLDAHPGVRVLATSRTAIGIRAERRHPVGPLETEAAVELLLAAAVQVACEPDLDLKRPLLVSICRRLDGHPLAILLAANQLSGLSAASLLNRLEAGWSPAMRGPADIMERHQTMARVLGDSVAELSPAARELLLVVGVFEGDFELSSAAEIAAATGALDAHALTAVPGDPGGLWDPIHELINHSLLSPIRVNGGPLESFRLTATVRDFARFLAEQSAQADALRRAHAEHFLRHVRSGAVLSGAEIDAWIRRTDAKRPDLMSALRYLTGAGDALSLEVGAGMREYWFSRGLLQEGIAALEATLALPVDHDSVHWVRALEAKAVLTGAASSYAAARGDLQLCLAAWERLDEPLARARTLVDLAAATFEDEGLEAVTPLFQEAIEVLDAEGDAWWAARARTLYGASAATVPEERERAMELLDQAITAFGRLGETAFANVPLQQMGRLLLESGHDAQAVAILTQGLRQVTDNGDALNASVFYNLLAEVGIARGDTIEAAEHHLEALRLSAAIGASPRFIWCIEGLATTIDDLGEKEYAARLVGLVRALRSSLNLQDWTEFPARPVDLSAVQHGLPADRYATLLIEGGHLTVGDVIDYVPQLLEAKRARPRGGRAANPDGLTSREVEVLRLIASGMTSRAIATELFISIETVGRHISNLYRKIGVSGRAEATAYAITNGLMGG